MALIRGLYRTVADGNLYAVHGSSLISVSSTGATQNLGIIAGSGRVGMADNGTQLCIVSGAKGYIYDTANGLSEISDADFPGADTVTFIDGFFVFNNSTPSQKSQFFISDLLDGKTYDALDFATAERYPDSLTRVFADHSELLLFGEESIEIWFNAGNADFPFARAQGSVIEQGLGARWTVEKVDESVVWLDNEGMVRRLTGINPERISTHAIENAISKGDWTNATSWSYVDEGHQFYVLNIPRKTVDQKTGTYVWDAATGLWHERQSYELDNCRLGFYAYAYGQHIVGDLYNGKLYSLSLDIYDEDGQPLIADLEFPQIQNDGERFSVHSLQLDMEVGSKPFSSVVIPYLLASSAGIETTQNATTVVGWNPDDRGTSGGAPLPLIGDGGETLICDSTTFREGCRSITSHSGSGKWQARFTISGTGNMPVNSSIGIADENTLLNDRPFDGSFGQNVFVLQENGGSGYRWASKFESNPSDDFLEVLASLPVTSYYDFLLNLNDNTCSVYQDGVQVGATHDIPAGITWYVYAMFQFDNDITVDYDGSGFTPFGGYKAWDDV